MSLKFYWPILNIILVALSFSYFWKGNVNAVLTVMHILLFSVILDNSIERWKNAD